MISFVATVLNEEKTIKNFLKSISLQTNLPDEVIIVDGGSTDNTKKAITKFISKSKLNIKFLKKRGNIAKGRNEGISAAKGGIIVVSDSGCILDKNFVKEIVKPLKSKKISVSSGFYYPKTTNIFEKCLSTYTSTMKDKLDEDNFLPSSRSIAFRKNAWKKVSGYPENLDTCEDLVFARKLKSEGLNFKFTKKAFVYWPQRKNFLQAFKQFFNYAVGDGQAHYFRKQTPFLFIRYFIGLILLLNFIIWNSFLSLIILILLLFSYILWSILKNYKYVKKKQALYLLPLLQLLSDIAVIFGMTYGYLKSLRFLSKKNIGLTLIIAVYSVLMLLIIKWGIPGVNHPFNYHMDEWHQLQAVRSVYIHGTNNIEGAANGPMFQFLLSGVYLAPFYFLKLIDPFSISSFISNLDVQENLFIILRINTLIFGILSIVCLWKIIKKHIKINPVIPVLFFTFSPIWLSLSNYFKYDIALIFWLILSLYLITNFINKPTLKMFVFSSIVSALAVSTKISAITLFPILILSYLLITKKIRNKIKFLLAGLLAFFIAFVIFGIPDIVFLNKGGYFEYFHSNLVRGPSLTSDYILGYPWYIYLAFIQYPIIFGIGLYIGFVLSLFYLVAKQICQKINKKKINKIIVFLILSFLLFLLSLAVLKIDARGNRSLVLLPFMAIITAFAIKDWLRINKKITYLLIGVLMLIQFFQSIDPIYIKIKEDTRQLSSKWIEKNIKQKSLIGLESVPIYQQVPDFILKDYYLEERVGGSYYNYEIIDYRLSKIPDNLIITNKDFGMQLANNNEKTNLLLKIKNDNYLRIKEFKPNFLIIDKIFNYNDIYFSGLMPISTIEIYQK